MIHHLVLFKLKPEADDAQVEWMMRETRMRLLKIPEVLNVKCGKNIDSCGEWRFFLAVDVESSEKLAMYADDPVHVKFIEEVIKPNISKSLTLDFETEPGKDVRYS